MSPPLATGLAHSQAPSKETLHVKRPRTPRGTEANMPASMRSPVSVRGDPEAHHTAGQTGGEEALRVVHAAQQEAALGTPDNPGGTPHEPEQKSPRRRGEREQRQGSRGRLALGLDRELRASIQSLGGPAALGAGGAGL